MFKIWLLGLVANLGLLRILNNRRGEAGGEDKSADKSGEKLLPQSAVDAIIGERVAREKAKFADYDDLKKFKTEHEKNLELATQKDLESRKEYDKAKEGWNAKQQELVNLVTTKDNEIKDMRLRTTLMGEIVRQNAYPDEVMALVKEKAVFDAEGNIRIKDRDANGLEVQYSVEEGIKNFLTPRPYLVKATKPNGAGTLPNNLGAGAGVQDLSTLNAELQSAMQRGDRKAISELKPKISALMGASKT